MSPYDFIRSYTPSAQIRCALLAAPPVYPFDLAHLYRFPPDQIPAVGLQRVTGPAVVPNVFASLSGYCQFASRVPEALAYGVCLTFDDGEREEILTWVPFREPRVILAASPVGFDVDVVVTPGVTS